MSAEALLLPGDRLWTYAEAVRRLILLLTFAVTLSGAVACSQTPEQADATVVAPQATATTGQPAAVPSTSVPAPTLTATPPATSTPADSATATASASPTPVISRTPAVISRSTCDEGLSPNLLPGLTIEAAIESGGLTRTYRVYIPTGVADSALPLVVAFHGLGGSGAQLEMASGLTTVAEREKFVVAYPDGHGSPRSWRIRGADAIFPSEVNDVAFVSDLVEHLQREACVDGNRVYATGHSNGAFFTSVLACEEPAMFAAIAPVAGLFYPATGCTEVVPTLAFHSTGDLVVPFTEGLIFGRLPYRGARAYLADWAETGGCSPIPYPSPVGQGASREGYEGCAGGAVTSLVVIEGGDHAWPGLASHGVSASEEAWAFFAQWTN